MIGLQFGGPSALSSAPGPRGRMWRERVWAARDRLLARPGFQRWAASFPLTRPIANRQARALFDLCAGFVYSQVLVACVQVDLFGKLAGGARSVEDVARLCALTPDAAIRLLEAATALRLVARRGKGRYGLGMLGAALRANPAIASLVRHHRLLYADLADPVALLRGTGGRPQLADYWPYATATNAAGLDAAAVADYTALMGASQAMIAGHVLDAYDVTRHRRLLDVGGGDGSFLTAVAARAPNIALALFDLPAVAHVARARLQAAGYAPRTQVVEGDFCADALPPGADLISLVRVLHDQDDARALALLRAVRKACADDGTVLIAEPLADTPGAAPIGAAYFGFYLLAMGRGRARTGAELRHLLGSAGFDRIEMPTSRMPLLASVIVAKAAPNPVNGQC